MHNFSGFSCGCRFGLWQCHNKYCSFVLLCDWYGCSSFQNQFWMCSFAALPIIKCDEHLVRVYFETKRPFQGHVYVRGHYQNDDCHRDYLTNKDTFGSMTIPFEKCGMRRSRTVTYLSSVLQLKRLNSRNVTCEDKNVRTYTCTTFRPIQRVWWWVPQSSPASIGPS